MFRRAREVIREVEPEVISPAELELVLGTEVLPRPEEPPAVEIEVAPPVVVEAVAPPDEAAARVETEPRIAQHRRKQSRAKRARAAQRAASAAPARSLPAEARPEPVEEIAAPEPESRPLPVDDVTCEIFLWRGYRKATFYARVFSDDGEPLAVAQSPSFRSRGNGTPERTDEAVAAYEVLREQLQRAGWQHVAPGDTWFGDVFSSPL